MSIEDLKVKPEILSPKPPSIATDEEFTAGTSTTASPTVKQAKEKLVTTDTTQTIIGQKVFTTELRRKSTVIDITTQPEKYTSNNGFRFVDKNDNTMGFLENSQHPDGRIRTAIHAKNKDNYQQDIGVWVPQSGTTGAYATAPSTPDNAPANAIVTKDKIANMVTTNTAQTISGVKTFTANTIVKGSGANNGTFTIKNDVTTYGTSAVDLVVATSNGKNQLLVHFQEGNKWCAYFEQNPSTKDVALSMGGCAAVYAPTPAVNANDTQVATTAWFNSKMQVVSALPANPDPNVFYFISG